MSQNVEINEVHTEFEFADNVALDPAESKRLVAMVLEHLRNERHMEGLRRKDDKIQDRSYKLPDQW